MTYLTQAIGQTAYNRDIPRGEPGLIRGPGTAIIMPYINSVGLVAPVYTVTPPATVDASAPYVLSVNGVSVSVTTDASPTTLELGTALYNAIRKNAEIFRLAQYALNTSTGVITISASFFNEPLDVIHVNAAARTNDLTIANTVSAAGGSNLGIGIAVGTQSSYVPDRFGRYPANAIDHATNYTFQGFVAREIVEADRVGPLAEPVFKPGQVFGVIIDLGTCEGVLVQCVESDITPADSAYIAISGDNKGKLTKTSSGNANVSSKVKIISNSFAANGKNLVYVTYRR